ncbi:hypothetical protein A2630_00885 [Candidatus Woesebacteria bacterium RIFCSPHIGHO2_01_FULL_44_10]|uniref:Small-conductance mechanosensitive ion channel n=1 Tax=Candidatus Woesebacteria bacterium RIFCSPLOWO2_01_FULL_44_14 TaxID=1802525 RepID=A0A1F8C1J3_9BACT|nr:MAG: hypothetical protein A2630_00885 [Candidatus Woesebacteria bacterium RIFCSPHIGHO2_01_FULL_44_10]OGM54323.1 MAG: hypothetical protein A3F62_01040 [Candidatus Woesebacteria bacterium RIFCSPHIGHO2_12_FULL_44_11]OGM70224.1 MAG: hypothetical protein A2975_04090 [Candidatus Woesebacteria bacterium RIFCSPLOWO2_01_FULL_44_14]
MNTLSAWQSALLASWAQVWASFLGILPNLLGAIVLFIVGLLLAAWAKRLVVGLFKLVKLEKLTTSAGVESYLNKAEIRLSFIELMGSLVQWLVILVFFLAVVDLLGLTVVSQVVVTVLGYLPNVIAAALIFAAGYIVAGLVEGLVRGALASVDHDVAKPVSALSRWVILLVAFFAAVDQLQVAQGLINTFFQGLTYTLVLVVGLSVGLGSKDLVSKILSDWYAKIKK